MRKNNLIKIATRSSKLALRQACAVKNKIESVHPLINVEIYGFRTRDDRFINHPYVKGQTKIFFIRELQDKVLSGEADIAIYPVSASQTETPPKGLVNAALLKREKPFDALISNKFVDLQSLPEGATIATSSPYRQAQLIYLTKKKFKFINLKGNLVSRLDKLERGEFDAAILPLCDLEYLRLASKVIHTFSLYEITPIVGQGAIAVECREEDQDIYDLISKVNDVPTQLCILAEKAMRARLGKDYYGLCAGHCTWEKGKLKLVGTVAKRDGSILIREEAMSVEDTAVPLGELVADKMLARGAYKLLEREIV